MDTFIFFVEMAVVTIAIIVAMAVVIVINQNNRK